MQTIEIGETAAIDLGEIHIAVATTGKKTIIVNGRELRSKKRYLNKATSKLQARIDKCKKGSRKRKQLIKTKSKMRKRLNNQIKYILHKQTTKLVCTFREENVKTIAIGDMRNIRQNIDYGKHANQKIHQMTSDKARQMIEYKCQKYGMETVLVNEAYTSQTCPKCQNRHKPTNRNYKCLFVDLSIIERVLEVSISDICKCIRNSFL